MNTKAEVNVWWEILLSNKLLFCSSQVDQYANFTIYYDGRLYGHNDTGVTPRENIADNGGMKVIFQGTVHDNLENILPMQGTMRETKALRDGVHQKKNIFKWSLPG